MTAASEYFSPRGVARGVMSWALGTRMQLDRWEPLVARNLWLHHRNAQLPDPLIWQAEHDHHFALVACRNLLRALALADDPVEVDPVVRTQVIAGRDLHEHWDENMPVFNVRPSGTPPRKSGKDFAVSNPDRSPYDWLAWKSNAGPMLLPLVAASRVHALLDACETWATVQVPSLTRFALPRPASPWTSENPPPDNWWPRPPATTD